MKNYFYTIAIITGIFVSFLWAHNNVEDNVENIQEKWGRIKSKDENVPGGLETRAYIDVDIDYPGESWWNKKYGIEYEAYSKAKASFQWGTHGTYSVDSKASVDRTLDQSTWSLWANESERAKHFERKRGADANALAQYTAADVRRHLGSCSASASITRIRGQQQNLNASDSTNTLSDEYYEDYESSASAG